jgi:hypothetical protein
LKGFPEILDNLCRVKGRVHDGRVQEYHWTVANDCVDKCVVLKQQSVQQSFLAMKSHENGQCLQEHWRKHGQADGTQLVCSALYQQLDLIFVSSLSFFDTESGKNGSIICC